MLSFITRRTLYAIPVLLGIIIVVFLLVSMGTKWATGVVDRKLLQRLCPMRPIAMRCLMQHMRQLLPDLSRPGMQPFGLE